MSQNNHWRKPVIILVPGAWNTDGSYNLVTPLLENAGYTTRCISLPSVGAQPPVEDIQPDIDAIRAVIQKEVNASQDVILVMHDYACIPAGEAVKGFDKATRLKNGLDGGVACLFYAASLLPPVDMFMEAEPSWIRVSRNQKVVIPERPVDVFCPEVEPELAKEFADSLKPHSYQTFLCKTTWEPYRTIPFFCLFCKLDKVIPLEKQKASAAVIGVTYKSSTAASGHCPFLSQPEEMAKSIRRAAKESTYYTGVVARDYGVQAGSELKRS